MPKQFEYTIELPLAPPAVFRLLTDSARWRGSRLYGNIRWLDGEPWQPGSTREVETLLPYHRRHRQRVLANRENELLEVMSHGFGYSNHIQLLLRPSPQGGTTLRVLNLVEGFLPMLFGSLEEFMQKFVEAWERELRRMCEEESRKQ